MKCTFDPEDHPFSDSGELIICPSCGHYVITGRPHPDFDALQLIISEGELTRLSLGITEENTKRLEDITNVIFNLVTNVDRLERAVNAKLPKD